MAYPKVRIKTKKKRNKPDELLCNSRRTKQERLDKLEEAQLIQDDRRGLDE